jgi:TonB family protein
MKLRWSVVALTFMASLDLGSAAGASADLDGAKALYASASYEEALVALSALPALPRTEDRAEINEYQALCFLALGRTDEAERALEGLVIDNPLFVMSGEDVSPRVVDLFHQVQKRTLPGVVQGRYGKAKEAYAAGRFDLAAARFRELAAIVSTGNLAEEIPLFEDMKQLADGFLSLLEAKIAATAQAVRPHAEAVPAKGQRMAADASRIYSSADTDVIPPVDVDHRRVPVWAPTREADRRATLRGVLQVVIDQSGAVESATLNHELSPVYDRALLAAARRWRFQPATRNEQPVKYLKSIEIVLRPEDE